MSKKSKYPEPRPIQPTASRDIKEPIRSTKSSTKSDTTNSTKKKSSRNTKLSTKSSTNNGTKKYHYKVYAKNRATIQPLVDKVKDKYGITSNSEAFLFALRMLQNDL